MEHVTYKKCVMERRVGRLSQRQTTWVPENLAHIGTVLKLRIAEGAWDNQWTVLDVALDPPEVFRVPPKRDWELVKF